MALGSGFGNYTPAAGGTGKELLKAATDSRPPKREALINVRVNADVVKCFKEMCEKSGTTMSDEIRRFIVQTVVNNGM